MEWLQYYSFWKEITSLQAIFGILHMQDSSWLQSYPILPLPATKERNSPVSQVSSIINGGNWGSISHFLQQLWVYSWTLFYGVQALSTVLLVLMQWCWHWGSRKWVGREDLLYPQMIHLQPESLRGPPGSTSFLSLGAVLSSTLHPSPPSSRSHVTLGN